jgi:hypothetical protein
VKDSILYKCKEARDVINLMSDKVEGRLDASKNTVANTPPRASPGVKEHASKTTKGR